MNKVLQIILKRIGVFIAGTAVCIAAAILLFVNLSTAGYEATAVIFINNDSDTKEGLEYEDLLASQRLAEYFGIFHHSGVYRQEVYQKLEMTPDEYEDMFKNLEVGIEKNTGIVTITLHHGVDTDSVKHLEAISNIMIGSFKELTGIVNISIISITQSEEAIRKGLLSVFILFGFLGGLVISTILAVVLENASDTIKSADDAGKYFNIPVLGIIPRFGDEGRGKNAGQDL